MSAQAFFESLTAEQVDNLRRALNLTPEQVAMVHDIAGTTPQPQPAAQPAAQPAPAQSPVAALESALGPLAEKLAGSIMAALEKKLG